MSTHGTSAKIPPTLLPELFDLSQSLHHDTKRVWNDHQLAAWLKSQHGIECSHDSVRKALLPLRQVARAAIADAIRAKIVERIPDQIEALDGLMDKVRALTSPARGKKPPSPAQLLGVLDEYRKGLETKLRFSGVGEKVEMQADVTVEEVARDDARDELAEALAREAAGAARRGAQGGSGGSPTRSG